MNLCPRCARSCENEDRFCGICGYNLTVQNASDFVTKYAVRVKDIQFDLGVVYFREGKYQEAFEIFERIHRDDPDNIPVIEMYERTREALNA